jgi:phenylalanyl-tRNA synthetase beta chain
MYIPLKWIKNLISLKNISLIKLCEEVTLSGFEIEEVLKNSDLKELDFILNVNLTANRSDILNIKGFVNELFSILLKKKKVFSLKVIKTNTLHSSSLKKDSKIQYFIWESFLQKKYFYVNKKNTSTSFEGCYTFFYTQTNICELKKSPQWLQKCLISANILPINNVNDTINFVTLETGYPFFVCDLDKLKNLVNSSTLSFSVHYASPLEKFLIEKDKSLPLSQENLLLYINKIPISIISLLTLKEIDIDFTTKNLLFYGGLFDPVQIRKSSQNLGIRTQQSISLEKNLNFNNLEQAYIRLKVLLGVQGIYFSHKILPSIEMIHPLKKTSFISYIQNKRPILQLNYKEVNNIRGNLQLLDQDQIVSILKRLNFQIINLTKKTCELYIPLSRQEDIEKEIDLIEEVIRISGFNNFSSIKPELKKVGTISKLEKLKRVLRTYLTDLGLNEIFHYSIVNTINSNFSEANLRLKNPVVTETSSFRKNLLVELINKYISNKNQKNKNYEAFEIGRAYHLSEFGDIIESEFISGIFGGHFYTSYWAEEKKSINWFEAKGFIEQTFKLLNISIQWSKITDTTTKILHPNRMAQLSIKNKIIGLFGQIHPFIAQTNSLIDEIYLFEFNLDILKNSWFPLKIPYYSSYSLYPTSSIDLAFIKKNEITFEEVKNEIYEIGKPMLESIELFDYYAGTPVPLGYHSIAFKLKFRTFNRTLTNQEINLILKKIKISLETKFDITIRT